MKDKTNKKRTKYFVYIVRCLDGTFYTGFTVDIDKRVVTHNRGKGAKYTRCRLPVILVHWEEYETKSAAMKREYQIKQMSRKQKERMVYDLGSGEPS